MGMLLRPCFCTYLGRVGAQMRPHFCTYLGWVGARNSAALVHKPQPSWCTNAPAFLHISRLSWCTLKPLSANHHPWLYSSLLQVLLLAHRLLYIIYICETIWLWPFFRIEDTIGTLRPKNAAEKAAENWVWRLWYCIEFWLFNNNCTLYCGYFYGFTDYCI